MAKVDNRKFIPDLLPAGTEIDVVKFDEKGDFAGIKSMPYGEWKKMEKQKGFTYRAYQKGQSSFNNQKK